MKKDNKKNEVGPIEQAISADITFVSDYTSHSVYLNGKFYNFKNNKMTIPECSIELKTQLLANVNIRELK